MADQVTETLTTKDTGAVLLGRIEHNPGIRYRELLRLTGLANGTLTYHLTALEKSNMIRVDRRSRMTHYYPIGISDKESIVFRCIRHEPVRQIILFLLDQNWCTFNEIVGHIKKAPSTTSSHLKKLKDDGVVTVKHGKYSLYSLTDRGLVYDVLAKYRASFTDKVVDNYVEMMEEF